MHTIPDSIAFLLRAGHKSGLGHWFRCQALTIELERQGISDINFVLPREPGQDRLTCAPPGHLVRIDAIDAGTIVCVLESLHAEAVILDLPDTSEDLVHALRRWPLASLGSGGPGRDVVPIRIDGMLPRPGYGDDFRGAFRYEGPEYIILRPEFASLRGRRREPQDPPESVLVMLGGSDLRGWSVRIARLVLRVWPEARVYVVLGPAANEVMLPLNSRIELLYDPPHVSELMAKAEVAVLSGGIALYEALSVGVPTLAIPVVRAQEPVVRACAEADLVEAPQLDSDRLVEDAVLFALRRMTSSRRRTLIANMMGVVDGRGAQRVADILLDHFRGMS